MTSSANDKLIKNLENQLERVVEQLKELEECRNDMPEDEYDLMKEETVDQIKEFSDTLDRMQKGDISLNNKLSMLKATVRKTIADSFNTIEMIKMFGDQNAHELEQQLLRLDEEYRLKKIVKDEFQNKKIEILTRLQSEGRPISTKDSEFLQSMRDNLIDHLERVEDD